MYKTVTLESGHEVKLYWTRVNGRYVLTEIVVWRHGCKLGTLRWSEGDTYTLWYRADQYDPTTKDEVADYYAAQYPDLAGEDRQTLFEKGFARAVDLAPVIERAQEMARAVNQKDKDAFLAINVEGQIVAYGINAHDAYFSAKYRGWRGWYSPDRADEQTLAIIPMAKVRAILT